MRKDLLYAVRGFKRAPLVAITVVATVALGLGLVTVAFTLLNMFLFGVDQVPNVQEMYAVERPRTSDGERAPFTRARKRRCAAPSPRRRSARRATEG